MATAPDLELSPKVSDEIRKTSCYMCACRCGINVHLQDGAVKYIEGNRDHPVNQGVLCAKGSAGIMQHLSPARLTAPLLRTGERGSGEFKQISWEEALTLACEWLAPLKENSPEKLAFFTGRDQSQSFTSFWAQQFGTPNYAAHGGFCSVNMATAGIYTMGGAFWEFGQPDWERAKLLMIFGVAEDHDSNPIKIGLGKMKARGAKVIGVNPVRSGYNAVADEWVAITPGTDGLFILSLIRELLASGQVDLDYLARYTNAPFLIDATPGAGQGLFLRDEDGKPLVKDRKSGALVAFDGPSVQPDLGASHTDEAGLTHRSAFQYLAEAYLVDEYAPETVAPVCGLTPQRIRGLAQDLARVAFSESIEIDQPWTDFRGQRHDKMIGRPVAFHAMRGISAHANGFQTCRALHLLQILLGSVETPGGFRFKPPYPKPVEAHPKPHAAWTPGAPLTGPHLGFVAGPDDLALDDDGQPLRIDKAFTWDNPMSAHGLMHMVISNAHAGDPYPIDTLFMYMANMAWNSSMNTGAVMEMLTDKNEDGSYRIPRFIYSDSYASETVAYADLILPDTTYLERHDCISLLDRPICEADMAADAIRWPVVEPNRDVRGFQSALVELGARLGLKGFVDDEGQALYRDYADYMVNHQRRPGIGPLAGFRGAQGDQSGRGEVNPNQLQSYIDNGGFWSAHIPDEARFFKPWNQAYQDWAVEMGFFDKPQPYVFQLYLEPMQRFQLAAQGHGERQPPEHLRAQVQQRFTPLPTWWPSTQGAEVGTKVGGEVGAKVGGGDDQDTGEYPLHALTQRPAAMYHSWGSQNAWLRQIHGENPLYVPRKVWDEQGFKPGDWAKLTSPHGSITVPVALMESLNENTVWTWNAIGKRSGAWALSPDAPEVKRGFLLNHLISELLPPKGDGLRWSNSDPITGQAAWFDLKVSIAKTVPPERSLPDMGEQTSPVAPAPSNLAFGQQFDETAPDQEDAA